MFQYSENCRKRADDFYVSAKGTVNERSHKRGMANGEPIIVMMDCLYKYAVAYQQHNDQPLQNDAVLGDAWMDTIKGVRALLNGDGAYAMLNDISTDSKDNGVVESMFWDAMKAAGFEEKDL